MSDKLSAREVYISREPIELYKVLKFEGLVNSGGEAKVVISAGAVQVNGTVETRKRRQISNGDTIEFAGEELRIHLRQREQE
ncbi:MAG: RNA-binding S4 domain-containing protein [Pseudomonadota bacterium]